jgi:hypothetical protein
MGDKIKTDLKKRGSEDVDGIHLTHDRVQWQALVNMVMGSMEGEKSFDQLSDYQFLRKDSVPWS